MAPFPHRIRCQRWTVQADSTAAAFAWRTFLSHQGQDLVLPLFEQAFAEIGGNDRFLHLPRLELHITVDATEPVPEKISAAILAQLRQHLHPLRSRESSARELPAAWQEEAIPSHQFDTLLYYLHTGSLPWHAAGFPAGHRAPALADTVQQQLPQLLEHLHRQAEPPVFFWRLLHLLPEAASRSLLTSLLEGNSLKQWEVLEICLAVLAAPETVRLSRSTRLQFLAALLGESLARRQSPFSPSLLALVLDGVPPAEASALREFIASLLQSNADLWQQKSSTTIGARTQSVESPALAPEPPGPAAASIWQLEPSGQAAAPDETSQPPVSPGLEIAASLPDLEPSEPQSEPGLFPMLVPQAGLILLHPFLPRFLEHTGVIAAGTTLLSAFARPRAAALLHFLAAGQREMYEYELGLIKILLGLLPATPLPVSPGLIHPEDVAAAEALLQSVIAHWQALKNTSINGLRSAFLQRQGLMREHEQGWLLQVERQPFDMLVEQLPWSISIVRLPWMPGPIFTEWSLP
jgi:hypothetical protein